MSSQTYQGAFLRVRFLLNLLGPEISGKLTTNGFSRELLPHEDQIRRLIDVICRTGELPTTSARVALLQALLQDEEKLFVDYFAASDKLTPGSVQMAAEDTNVIESLENLDFRPSARKSALKTITYLRKSGGSPSNLIYLQRLIAAHHIFRSGAQAFFASSPIDHSQQNDGLNSQSGEFRRELHFTPECRQAGIGILSYFSEILQQKLPDADASVIIRQAPDRVSLLIQHADGAREEIEQLYSTYGLVVTGRAEPTTLFLNSIQLLRLQQKLQNVELELRQTQEIRRLEQTLFARREDDQRDQIHYLRDQLGKQLGGASIFQSKAMDAILAAVNTPPGFDLTPLINAIETRDKDRLAVELNRVDAENPNLLDRLHTFLVSNAFGGVIGNSAYDWLKIIWPVVLK